MLGESRRINILFWVCVIIALLAVSFGFQGTRGLWEPDEGYYVSTALQMHETGDLFIPRLNHEPFLEKPPLTYWGVVGGLKLLGHNEWAVRLFHSVCFMLTIVVVFFLGRAMHGSTRTGLIASIVYGTMTLPFAAANIVTPDTPLVLWTTLACLCFWQSVKPGAEKVAMWKVLLCVSLGVGFMTKSTAALIPTGGMFLYLILTRQVSKYFITFWALPCLAVFVMLGLSWYYLVGRTIPSALNYFWVNQVWGRTVANQYSRNPGLHKGFLIYIPALLLGTLPWSLVWYARWKNLGALFQSKIWKALKQDESHLFLSCWVGVTFCVLVLASSKLLLYILPVFPAVAVAISKPVEKMIYRVKEGTFLPNRWAYGICVWVVVLLGIRLAVAWVPSEKDSRSFWNSIKEYASDPNVEIVLVDEKLNGLRFYGAENIECVTTSNNPHPFFSELEPLQEEIDELRNTAIRHVFLCKNSGRADKVRNDLKKAQFAFEEKPLPYKHVLIVCATPEMSDDIIRFATMGDGGTGESGQLAMSSALYLTNGETGLSGGIILLGDNFFPDPEEMANPSAVFKKCFDIPYHSLLEMGISFYGVLGNHDYRFGFDELEVNYPGLNFNGKHYYSKVFGDNLVELFVLDSQRMIFDMSECSKQISWLENALSNSTARWKIVATHHPLYSTAKQHPSDPYMISNLEPLFQRFNVNVVLQGHNHIYERLIPIHGVNYFTVGSGGRLREGDIDSQHANSLAAGNDSTYVFLTLEFHRNRCEFVARDMLRKVIDQGTIDLQGDVTRTAPVGKVVLENMPASS